MKGNTFEPERSAFPSQHQLAPATTSAASQENLTVSIVHDEDDGEIGGNNRIGNVVIQSGPSLITNIRSHSSPSSPLLDRERDHANHRDDLHEAEYRTRAYDPNWWEIMRKRVRYYIPILGWLPVYSFALDLRSDFVAGLTVASLLVPQSLSFAQALVRIPPVHGLISAFWACFCYGILGTSRQLSLGPEALVSILVGSAVRDYMSSTAFLSTHNPISVDALSLESVNLVALLCLLVGLFTFLLGFFRLGFLDSVLSRALIRGFVLAVACVVVIDMSEQLLGLTKSSAPQCTGMHSRTFAMVNLSNSVNGTSPYTGPFSSESAEESSPIQTLFKVLSKLPEAHFLTSCISFCSIAFLFGMSKVKQSPWARATFGPWLPVFPEIFILVVCSTLLCWVFRWDCMGVNILNHMSNGSSIASRGAFFIPHFPVMSVGKIKFLILSAILISVIGFVESIAVAKTYSTKYNYAISPNRELVAMGVGNIVTSFFGGFPSFGSLGRSALADSAGAKSQFYSLLCSLFLLLTLLFALPLFEFLPLAVCSAIITVAALRLIDIQDIYFLLEMRAFSDLGLMAGTFLTTLLLSIETGTLLSVGVSLLMVVKYTTRTKLAILRRRVVLDEDGIPKDKYVAGRGRVTPVMGEEQGCIIIKIEESLFFGNCGQLKDKLKRIELHGDLGVHPGEDPLPTSSSLMFRRRRASTGLNDEDEIEHEPLLNESSNNDEESDDSDNLGHALHAVIFDIGNVITIDATATQIMLEIVQSYLARGITVCFVKMHPNVESAFTRSGIFDLVGSRHFFAKIRDAVVSCETHGRL